ncbi:MAG: DUF4142 domain-containing protein [Alphaproteobacteria bacterium]|nr:DUF4142 domain-containing protein [Alphaproteobacteria bacterium]
MKKHTVMMVGMVSLICMASAAVYASTSDKDFVHEASVANEFEMEAGKITLEKSQDAEIKNFAQRMIDDHTKTAHKLTEALHNSKKSHAQATDKLDEKHQKIIKELEGTSGEEYEKLYIKEQIKAHKEAVSLFTDYSRNGEDPVLKEFATETLPTLSEHLKHAKALNASR